MDFLTVLAPTLWCNYLFGFSSNIVNSDGVRPSRLLKIYRFSFCAVLAFLQLGWGAQHLYFKYKANVMTKIQEIILLFCVASNMIVSLLPCNSLFSNDSVFLRLLYRIHRYEREFFVTKTRKLRWLLVGNAILLISGFTVPFTFMSLDAFRTWRLYSIGRQYILTDITGLGSGFLRPAMDVVLLDTYFMYMVVFGTTYANINEFLTRFAEFSKAVGPKHGSAFFLRCLKVLEDADNVLKDFHGEIMGRHTAFCVFMVILSLFNWFYVVGFIFLNLSPLFFTYYAWVTFFTIIFGFIVCGNVYARQQVERTPGLLYKIYSESDDPRIMEEVEILSLQLLHRKVEFDAGGFFKMDFSLLLSMIGIVTTYVLILIQFEDPGIGKKCHIGHANLTNFKTV